MRARAIVVGGTVVLATLLGATIFACSSDDKTTTEPARQSRKGEACQVSGDCLPGLGCKPNVVGSGGTCVVANFNVSVTAKECVESQCTVAADCCNISPSLNCSMLQSQCADAGPTSSACMLYNAECVCSRTDCINDRCVSKCTTDTDCFATGLPRCAGGVCVQCGTDMDCGSGGTLQCINGRCQEPCMSDGDCPGFQRCVDAKCVESGCQTDRECIAGTRNVESTCGTDGKCIVPCQTDLECGSPTDYKFISCINNQCIYTGCQTDKDCRIFFTGPSDASIGVGPHEHFVCRDKSPGSP